MKTVYVMALLAILFASISAAYSMWSETLQINNNIETGKVAVSFDSYTCRDEGPDPQMNSNFNNDEGKDVGACSIEVQEVDSDGNKVVLQVDVSNAYPGYLACIDFTVANTGTIPVKLYNYDLTGVNSTALNVTFTVPDVTQIHAGESSDTYTLCIGINQEADEDASYSFQLELTFAQWNEVSGP